MSLNLRNEAALYSGDMAVDDQAHLLTFPLPTPIAVFALDGRLLAQVTHRTVPLPLLLSGNHREHIQLLIIPSPQSPLVFGHTWLKLHNPQIDWSLSKFVSWSAHCYSTCLHSAAPSCTQVAPVCLTPIGLTSAPSPYNDLSDVFSKGSSTLTSTPPTIWLRHWLTSLCHAPFQTGRHGIIHLGLARWPNLTVLFTRGVGFFFVGNKDHSDPVSTTEG